MSMIALIRLALGIVASLFKSRARLEAENAALRRQLIVLRRKLPGRVKLFNGDRTFFVWLYRLSSGESRVTLFDECAQLNESTPWHGIR